MSGYFTLGFDKGFRGVYLPRLALITSYQVKKLRKVIVARHGQWQRYFKSICNYCKNYLYYIKTPQN